jgi:hypothetical protein
MYGGHCAMRCLPTEGSVWTTDCAGMSCCVSMIGPEPPVPID